MDDFGWWSLLPPLLAIVLALTTRQVYLALLGGIWLGASLLAGGALQGLRYSIDAVVDVLASAGDARVLLFTLIIGGLIATLEAGGGVRGFIDWLKQRRWVTNGRRAQWLAMATGVVIFIESNITVLVAGSVSRPLFDHYRIAREKLAYIVDSTSAPICILIPLNAWGAFNLGLLDGLGVENSLSVFVQTIGFNFYAIAAVVMTGLVIGRNWNIGPMLRAQQRTEQGQLQWSNANSAVAAGDELDNSGQSDLDHAGSGESAAVDASTHAKARNMVLPIFALVLMMPLGLWITGDGQVLQGSGSTAVLWAVLAALAVSWLLLISQRVMSIDALTHTTLKGMGNLVPMALILLLALALGGIAKALGSGEFVASLIQQHLAPVLALPMFFLAAGFIAFSVGSSWGTFAIMLPIAVPAAIGLEMPLAPFVAAVLSGGIFGDHSSPISDTTVISSMASGADHIEHVRTQLPYALLCGAIATLGFAAVGLVIA